MFTKYLYIYKFVICKTCFNQAEVTTCNVITEDYLLSVKLEGDSGLQNFLTNFFDQYYEAIANILSQTEVGFIK